MCANDAYSRVGVCVMCMHNYVCACASCNSKRSLHPSIKILSPPLVFVTVTSMDELLVGSAVLCCSHDKRFPLSKWLIQVRICRGAQPDEAVSCAGRSITQRRVARRICRGLLCTRQTFFPFKMVDPGRNLPRCATRRGRSVRTAAGARSRRCPLPLAERAPRRGSAEALAFLGKARQESQDLLALKHVAATARRSKTLRVTRENCRPRRLRLR